MRVLRRQLIQEPLIAICTALHALELSAHELVYVVLRACAPFGVCVDYGMAFAMVCAVKHYHERKQAPRRSARVKKRRRLEHQSEQQQ